MNETFCVLIKFHRIVIPAGPIDNKSALVQVMALRQTGALTSIDPVHWRIYAAQREDELNYRRDT